MFLNAIIIVEVLFMSKKYPIGKIMKEQFILPTKLFTHYTRFGLNELDMMLIVQIYRYLQSGINFPTPKEIAQHLTISEDEVIVHLRKLIQKNMLEIKEISDDSKLSEAYSLEPLWEKLYTEPKETTKTNEGTIFILFEQEFGRPLSPFEIETINIWLDEDNLKPALIKAALRESVLMGKLNFKYIDRILREWQRKGIQSVEEAREASKSYHKGQVKKQYQTKKRDTSVYFNWIKGEE